MTNPNVLNRVLGLTGAFALTWAAATSLAQTPLPIYEPVPAYYTNGTPDETVQIPQPPESGLTLPARRINNSPANVLWSVGGGAGGGSALAVGGAATLNFPGLYQDLSTNSVGICIRTNGTTANRTRGIRFATASSGSLYSSFLLNIRQSPTNSRLFAKLDNATTGTGSSAIAGVWLTPTNTLGLSKNSASAMDGTAVTPELTAGTTYLVVARYTWNAGTDDDEVSLWLNPAANTLNAPEGNVPPATISLTTGTDLASLSTFFIHHPQSGQVPAGFFMDEFRIATTWADVTSTQALCYAASVATPPANTTVNEGVAANFSAVFAGSSPAFQWQVSANNGVNWANVSSGLGGNSASYQTPVCTPADNSKQYRVIATTPCNGLSSTSAPATLTVINAAVTPNGVVVDDVFQDGGYNNGAYGISNSIWFDGISSGSLDASSGSLIGTPQAGSANWVGYYTDNAVTNLPVHLDVGKELRAQLVFKGSSITASNGGLRMGIFNYADGATRLTANGFGNNVSAANARGYLFGVNYGTIFSGNPVTISARQNLAATDLMGTAADYLQLGGGPADLGGQPAFQNGTAYTVEFKVSRKTTTSCDVTCTITGGGSNWTHTVTDNTYAYPRFDTIAVRTANATSTASQLEFTRLLVEVVNGAPSAIPLNITSGGGNVTLTWSNPSFNLQAASLVTGTYTNVTGATSPHVISAGEAQKFFRLAYP